MHLDRKLKSGRGKYALVLIRVLKQLEKAKDFSATSAVDALAARGVVDFGATKKREFFVIRLKDKYAAPALAAYAMAAYSDDPKYAEEVLYLAKQAAIHPDKQTPT